MPCYGIGPANDCPQSTFLDGVPAIAMIDAAGIPLTADQEFQAGFTCNGVHATPTTPLPCVCPASQFGSTLTQVPTPGTENDDHNPPRIAPAICSTWLWAPTISSRAIATAGARKSR